MSEARVRMGASSHAASVEAITGAIFDCDGTLLDSLDAWRGLEAMLASEAGIVVTLEERAAFVSYTIPEVARHFHERHGLGATVEAVVALIDDYMMAYYERAAVLPGVTALLEQCAAANVRMAVASSSAHAYLEAGLRAAGIRGYFDAVFSVNDVGAPKREPLIFERACQALGTQTATTWGLDDAVYAVETLARAGFPTVGIYGGEDGASRDDMARVATIAVGSLEGLTVRKGVLTLR